MKKWKNQQCSRKQDQQRKEKEQQGCFKNSLFLWKTSPFLWHLYILYLVHCIFTKLPDCCMKAEDNGIQILTLFEDYCFNFNKQNKSKTKTFWFWTAFCCARIPFWKLRVLFLFPGCPENSFTGRGRALCSADGMRGPGPLCTSSRALSPCPCTVPSAATAVVFRAEQPCCCPWVFPFQFQSWFLTVTRSSANYNPRLYRNIKIWRCIKIHLFQNNCIAKSRNIPHPWFWRHTEFMHFCMHQ